MKSFHRIAPRAMLLLAVLLLAVLRAAPSHATPVAAATYRVSIDTGALAGQSGYLDFLLMSLGGAEPVHATIGNFTGAYGTASILAGDAAGGIATGVTLGNGAGWNEFGQWADFGGVFSFNVGFSGLPGAGDGVNLGIALLDQDFNYLGSAADVVTFALLPGEAVQFIAQPGMATVAGAVDLPEPATLLQVCAGLASLAALRRRRT